MKNKLVLFAGVLFVCAGLMGCLKTITDLTGSKLNIAEEATKQVISLLGYDNITTLSAGYQITPVSNSVISITSSGDISVPLSMLNYINQLSIQG